MIRLTVANLLFVFAATGAFGLWQDSFWAGVFVYGVMMWAMDEWADTR